MRLMVRPISLQAFAKELMSHSIYSTLSVCGYGSVVFKQYLPYQYFPDLSHFSETCKVEEVSIASGLKIHTII